MGVSEIVCAALRLSVSTHHLDPGEALPHVVEVLMLTSTERYANTRQLPLICVPSGTQTDAFVRDSLEEILGTMLSDSEIHHMSDAHQLKSSKRRRPLCLLILKNSSSLELQPKSRRAAAGSPAFYTLSSVRQGQYPCGKQSFACVQRIVEWLSARYSRETISNLFNVRRISVGGRGSASPVSDSSSKQHPEVVVANPLRAAGLQHTSPVDIVVYNPLRRLARSLSNASDTSVPVCRYRSDWESDFPVHAAARRGDNQAVLHACGDGKTQISVERDAAGWMPIHYAAWYDHSEVVTTLLDRGCCPRNVTTLRDGRTPLHLAAMAARVEVVELLLGHGELDPHLRDGTGRTPYQTVLDLLTSSPSLAAQGVGEAAIDDVKYVQRLHKVSELLKNAARERKTSRIAVHLMDGTHRVLALSDGFDTNVQQLQNEMLLEMNLPPEHSAYFNFWICSKCLQLQLKPHDKPLVQLHDWRRAIIPALVDWASPVEMRNDEPKLFWRREVRLSVEREKQTQQLDGLRLLFHEAYQNYIKSFYPCAEKDVLVLATTLLFIRIPANADDRKVKSFLNNEKQLQTVIPPGMLKNQPQHWMHRLTERYRSLLNSHSKRSREELEYRFLSMCWNLTVYGSWFFTAYINIKSSKNPVSVFVGINDIGVHILHGLNKTLLQSFQYADLLWIHESTLPLLDLRWRTTNHSVALLKSKQAGLMSALMDTMVTLTKPSDTKS